MNIQNLAALAAMTQPSLQAAQQPSAQLSNAAALICKYLFTIRIIYHSSIEETNLSWSQITFDATSFWNILCSIVKQICLKFHMKRIQAYAISEERHVLMGLTEINDSQK